MRTSRVIVCGTNYGQAYLTALRSQGERFTLAGIVARGSPRSARFAEELGVPLYRSAEAIPDNSADIACVAVGDKPAERSGTELARALIQRGIHVLQEHPVYPADVVRTLKKAKDRGLCYHINTQFPDVEPVATFIREVSFLRERLREREPLLFAHATSSAQCLYSLVDVLARALGSLDPCALSPAIAWDAGLTAANQSGQIPFRCLQGVVGGVPMTLEMQGYYDPNDVGFHQLVTHRVWIGTARRNVTLLNSFGPVIVSESPYAAGYEVDQSSDTTALRDRGALLAAQEAPLTRDLHGEGPLSFAAFVTGHAHQGILAALRRLALQIETGAAGPEQAPERVLAVSSLWLQLMQRFGPLTPVRLTRDR